MTQPVFFETPALMREWLAQHGALERELWVGYHKVGVRRPSITWAESVDQALCFGWIDGLRKRIDAERYMIRFTPRKPGSVWSAVNIKRVAALSADGALQPAGRQAFDARRENRSGIYSYEQRLAELPEPYLDRLRRNRAAAAYFTAQPTSYRKAAIWWVISAKQEATRLRRLQQLVDDSQMKRRIRQFVATARGQPDEK